MNSSRLAQILLGLFFLLSGLLKAIDPVVTAGYISQYLNILGLSFPNFVNITFALLLNVLEFTLGIMFILNIKTELTLWTSTLLMLVFTPKTLYVAVTKAMKFSGCFGNIIPLTPWQSHWKNVFMDLLLIFLWFKRKNLLQQRKYSNTTENVIIIATAAIFLIFEFLML